MPGLILGLLREALGAILAPRAAWDSKKEPDGKNVSQNGPHLGVHFRHCSGVVDTCLRPFLCLRFDSYQDRFVMDFGRF